MNRLIGCVKFQMRETEKRRLEIARLNRVKKEAIEERIVLIERMQNGKKEKDVGTY